MVVDRLVLGLLVTPPRGKKFGVNGSPGWFLNPKKLVPFFQAYLEHGLQVGCCWVLWVFVFIFVCLVLTMNVLFDANIVKTKKKTKTKTKTIL